MSIQIVQSEPSTQPVVVLTPAAVAKTKEFLAGGDGCLRVGVRGGGCSGFQYQLAVDHRRDSDLVWEQDGITVLCEREAAAYLRGTTLDYKETLEEAGFAYDNPNAVGGCGCGSSFRVTEDCDGVPADAIYGL